jgi:hypothetical protein
MSSPILPINFNNPPSLPVKGDVSSLTSKDTINTLNNIKSPTTFGDQTKASGQVIKSTGNSTLDRLNKKKALLIQEEKQLDIDHQRTLFELEQQNKKYKAQQIGQPQPTPQPVPPALAPSNSKGEFIETYTNKAGNIFDFYYTKKGFDKTITAYKQGTSFFIDSDTSSTADKSVIINSLKLKLVDNVYN